MPDKLTPEQIDMLRRTNPARWHEVIGRQAHEWQNSPSAVLQAVGQLTREALDEATRRGLPRAE